MTWRWEEEWWSKGSEIEIKTSCTITLIMSTSSEFCETAICNEVISYLISGHRGLQPYDPLNVPCLPHPILPPPIPIPPHPLPSPSPVTAKVAWPYLCAGGPGSWCMKASSDTLCRLVSAHPRPWIRPTNYNPLPTALGKVSLKSVSLLCKSVCTHRIGLRVLTVLTFLFPFPHHPLLSPQC